jgi:hypothetical protein
MQRGRGLMSIRTVGDCTHTGLRRQALGTPARSRNEDGTTPHRGGNNPFVIISIIVDQRPVAK